MDDERWALLMQESGRGFTDKEILEGWHCCPDWDYLLICFDSPESESCECKQYLIKRCLPVIIKRCMINDKKNKTNINQKI